VIIFLIPLVVCGWTEPMNISQTPRKSNCAAIAVGRDGSVHVVWVDFQTWPDEQPADILYRCCCGDSWCEVVNVSHDSTESWDPRIAVDTFNHPHVIWVDRSHWGPTYKLYYSYFDGDTWTTPIPISDSLQGGFSIVNYGDIAIDSKNRIHLVWQDAVGDRYHQLYYAVRDSSGWSSAIEIHHNPAGSNAYPRITIDRADNLHLVWLHYGAPHDDRTVEVYYSKYENGTWSTPINVSRIPEQSDYPNIAVGPDNNPHVTWEERQGYPRVFYSYYDDNEWSTPVALDSLLTPSEEGYLPDLIVDHYGNVHVAWNGTHEQLWYTCYNGSEWSPPVDISDQQPGNALFVDLAIDSTGCLHVVWTDGGGQYIFDIFYRKHCLSGIEELNLYVPRNIVVYSDVIKFEYVLPVASCVQFIVSNLLGQVIKSYDLGYKPVGKHSINISTEHLAPGVYFYSIVTTQNTLNGKLIIVK